MCKKLLRVTQMPDADVLHAQSLASDLMVWETRRPGDTANAMRRVADRWDIPHGTLWALRYRPPKRVWAHILRTLQAAHAAERERQLRKLAHEHEITARIAGAAHPAVAAASAALRQVDAADPSPRRGGLADGPAEPPRPEDRRLVDPDLEPTPDREWSLTTPAAPR